MATSAYTSFPRLDWQIVEQSSSLELESLALVWQERRDGLAASGALEHTLDRLQNEWAIETGLVDRLYSWERCVTDILMGHGVGGGTIELAGGADRGDGARISHITHDHFGVIVGLLRFVRGEGQLTTSYIQSLHAHFSRHQDSADILQEDHSVKKVSLQKGEYRSVSAYSRKTDGALLEHCPPLKLDEEMLKIIEHHDDWHQAAPPEVLAAWIHHAVITVHPFQDANGRVARALATLVFLRAGLFPLIIRTSDRKKYLAAVRSADSGNLQPLVHFFARRQRDTILEALGAPQTPHSRQATDRILDQAVTALKQRKRDHELRLQEVFTVAQSLQNLTEERLKNIAERVDQNIRPLAVTSDSYHAECRACTSDDRASHYYFRELVRTARSLRYYANTQPHRTWVRIAIETEEIFYFVISFHSIGQQFEGVLGACAFTFQRLRNEEGGRDIVNLQSACDGVFQFNYLEDQANVIERFQSWLDLTVADALEQWRKTLST